MRDKLLKKRIKREQKRIQHSKRDQETEENVVESKFEMFYPHLKYMGRRQSTGLPFFIQTMGQPRKLTLDEIRTLGVNEKFAREAHNMFFYPPGMAFYPALRNFYK
jgi:hypothetical protein